MKKEDYEILHDRIMHKEYQPPDLIPGTTKTRTYCGNAAMYTRESCVERMRNGRYRPKQKK